MRYGLPLVDDTLAAFSMKSAAVLMLFCSDCHLRRRNRAAVLASWVPSLRMKVASFRVSMCLIRASIFSFSLRGFSPPHIPGDARNVARKKKAAERIRDVFIEPRSVRVPPHE